MVLQISVKGGSNYGFCILPSVRTELSVKTLLPGPCSVGYELIIRGFSSTFPYTPRSDRSVIKIKPAVE